MKDQIGYFMEKKFKVNDRKIFTINNLSGKSGSDWAVHEMSAGRNRSQYVAPKLRSYTFDILLRAQDGVNPRKTMEYFRKCSEQGKVDYFIVGGKPLSSNPFKITDVSEEWNTVLHNGILAESKISLTIEEYL